MEKLRAGIDFSGKATKVCLSSPVRAIDAISAIGGLSSIAELDGVQNEARRDAIKPSEAEGG
jgi:hypothetical protein